MDHLESWISTKKSKVWILDGENQNQLENIKLKLKPKLKN